MSTGVRYASFDGDADRVVYYYLDTGVSFLLQHVGCDDCLQVRVKIMRTVLCCIMYSCVQSGVKYNLQGGGTVQLSGPPSSFPGPPFIP